MIFNLEYIKKQKTFNLSFNGALFLMVLPYVTLSLMLYNIQFFALNTSNYDHKDNGNILGNREKTHFALQKNECFFNQDLSPKFLI